MPYPDTNIADSRPPGVLPKNIHYVVLGGIVILVVLASVFSGQRATKAVESKSLTNPTEIQKLTTFQQFLDKQRREAEDAKRRLDAARHQQEAEGQSSEMQPAGRRAVVADPLEERRRARAAAAPFASSFSIQPTAQKTSLDLAPQVVLRFDAMKQEEGSKAAMPTAAPQVAAKESGRLLPAREGSLYRLFEGTMIQTSLVNRLDGSFTGPVQCRVSKDVRSKDGSAVLIPVGSKFFGKASKVQEHNQARLAVSFERVLLPNGYSIDLEAAPGLDKLGETGLKDKVNNHRVRSFGISGALGLLGGLALYGGQGIPFASGVANRLGNTATDSLNQFLNSVPTITIREGHAITVYLPNDFLLPQYKP